MNFRRIVPLLFLCFPVLQTVHAQTSVPRPKLVVGIVVDQMRWDFLYKYYDRYGAGGFKRLLSKGTTCEAAFINYLPTYTAPGHACIYTGSVPAINGMAGNDWIEKDGRRMYCTADDTARSIGGSSAGRMSPRNLLTTTITDELRLATNMRSSVYSVALKDRGAILPGGHLGNGAYWFDDSTGRFISSSHYGEVLPAWLNTFNAAHSNLRADWNLLYPAGSYRQSLPDDNLYEGLLRSKSRSFPHNMELGGAAGFGALRYTPAGNTLTLECALACLNGNNLGKDKGRCDFLTVSLSSTDYAGHLFGPDAVEIEDMYLRLDASLAAFLSTLDKEVGAGEYLLFLTADHGAAHNADHLRDLRIPAGNAMERNLLADLQEFATRELASFGGKSLIEGTDNYSVYLNTGSLISETATEQVYTLTKRFLRKREGMAWVVDMEKPEDLLTVPATIQTMLINGYHRERTGRLRFVMKPGWYAGYQATGTTHGTPYPFDTHIPLLFYGWNIGKGEVHGTVHMEDIAPTLAALLHIQMPNGCVGKAIDLLIR